MIVGILIWLNQKFLNSNINYCNSYLVIFINSLSDTCNIFLYYIYNIICFIDSLKKIYINGINHWTFNAMNCEELFILLPILDFMCFIFLKIVSKVVKKYYLARYYTDRKMNIGLKEVIMHKIIINIFFTENIQKLNVL